MSGQSVELIQRHRVIQVFLVQGIAGFIAVAVATVFRFDETRHILGSLGSNAAILIAIFCAFSIALGLLKFELTDLVFASLLITVYIAMFPLLGIVLSSWIAVLTAAFVRILGMLRIGRVKIDMDDPVVEFAKLFGLFGTYGLPVVLSSWLYTEIGGEVPVATASFADAWRIGLCGTVLILANNLVMMRVMRGAYGYSGATLLKLSALDASIYFLTLPYAICVALAYAGIGWGAVLSLAFSGVLANFAARNLAITRSRSQQQVQRLASLSNIGKTLSLRVTTDQLLMAIYVECKKIVDVSLFSIALIDEQNNELSFELDIRDGQILPKERMPVGEGLNSWVVQHREPLLIGSVEEERKLGITAVADTKPTESWLGVPMIARDHLIGVISVESYRKHVFTRDDVLLLTSIANQAAVALENANLYKDLEGLTFALEQRVQERTNELRETNLRLMAADRSKNQFLANMSHELRTPLNSIIGFSSVLLQSTSSSLPARLYKFLENIHAAGNHLLALINDILDLSKIEAGKMELRPEWFDLRDTIASVERVMRGFASEANVTIVPRIDPGVQRVFLDEGRMKQILFNLLSNAIKFSPAGGPVTIDVQAVPKESSALECDSVRIEVMDRGTGMHSEELDRIFDEFYQTEEGRRAAKGGTGLGLPLTRNFIELHYGTIAVRSAPGQGSTFTMLLPVDFNEAARIRPARAVRREPMLARR